MNCILKTSKEFKSLLKETNLHPFVLEVKIAKWQEINGVDNYPTTEDIIPTVFFQKNPLKEFAKKWNIGANGFSMNKLAPDPRMITEANNLGYGISISSTGSYYINYAGKKINPWSNGYQSKSSSEKKEVNKELNDKLKTFLSAYGIGLEYVESLEKLGYDAIAIADITNRMIKISKGEESIDTLPEEVAHFAVELLGKDNPLIVRLMSIIETSDIYRKTLAEYGNDPEYMKNGKTDLEKIKKEAIGKAIAGKLVRDNESKSVWRTIELIWEKLMIIFKRVNKGAFAKEIDYITLNISRSMLDGTFRGDIKNLENNGIGILKQKPKVSSELEKLKKAVKVLENRLSMAERDNDPLENTNRLKNTITEIKEAIENRKAQAGLSAYILSVIEQIDPVLEIIDSYKQDPDSVYLNLGKIRKIIDFVKAHEVVLSDLSALRFDADFTTRNADTLKIIKDLVSEINEIKEFTKLIFTEQTINLVGDLKHSKSTYDETTIFDTVSEDNSLMNLWLGKASSSKDELIRMVKHLLNNIKNKVERFTIDAGKLLLDKQLALERTGFKDFGKFYERDSKGNKTGYLISKYNVGEYTKSKREHYENMKKTIGVEEINFEKMSTQQISLYNKIHSEWISKNINNMGAGITVPSNKYLNPVYATMDKAQLDYYNALLSRQRDNLNKLPAKYRNAKYAEFKLPAVRKDLLHRLKSKEQSIFSNFKEIVKEQYKVMEDDTQFGTKEIHTNSITGETVKFLPIHYTEMLDNPNNISDDLTSIYIAYTHMAESFHQKSINKDKIWAIQKVVEERPYESKNKGKKGAATNVSKMLENIINADFYEQSIEKTKLTKITDTIIGYVRRNNLLLNVFTHIANYTVGSIYSKIEDAAGIYTTQSSKIWAEKTMDLNSKGIMSDMGSRKKTNKISLLMEHNSVMKDSKRIFSSLDLKTKAGRMLMDSGLWATYELADFRVKGKIMLSVYNNYRFFDNRFVNFKEFSLLNKNKDTKEINSLWNKLEEKSLWNMYDAVDGKLVIRPEVTENTKNMIKSIINQVSDQVDGKLSENDRPELYRHEIGRAVLLHRGWLLQGADARWKSSKLNYETGQFEEGYHKTFLKVLGRGIGLGNSFNFGANTYGEIIKYEKNLFTGALKEAYKNMTPEEKANTAKALADMVFIMIALIVAGSLKELGDDDENKDDYSIQFMAYMGQRFKLELTAFSNPFEVFQILSSPSAGINQIESIFDLAGNIISWDEEGNWKFTKEVDRGAYKGMPKWEKILIQRSFLKPFYEVSSTEGIKAKRQFLENLIMN